MLGGDYYRLLAEVEQEVVAAGGEGDDGFVETHIEYEELYASIIFIACIYASGQIVRRVLRMPPLVGEIFAGIILGPNLIDFVPYPISFVMLGEIGLLLLILDAGVGVDLDTLRLVGGRGLLVGIVCSILPMSIGFGISLAIGTSLTGSLAAGACFGPTSAGIAMATLKRAGILDSPVGQLIVCAAMIDDMFALVVLSTLNALVGDPNTALVGDQERNKLSILVPIVSALGYLFIGGAIAVRVLPPFLERVYFARIGKENHGPAGVLLMFIFLFAMMPATYYAKTSYLMGAFLSGLVFCSKNDVKAHYTSQFKRILQWLMRIFFAASIGFQVPIRNFADGRVIAYGFLYTLALTGKFAVGFMTPNFDKSPKFRGSHLRDCLITGCSMTAEAEFAFIVAVFGKEKNLFSLSLYSSIVFAIVCSEVFAPFALQFTISYWNNHDRQSDELQIMEPSDEKVDREPNQLEQTIEEAGNSEKESSLHQRVKGDDKAEVQN
jgi:Kef-type K+ transport system membrane component KefB